MTTSLFIRALIRESLLLELRNPPGESIPSDSKYFAHTVEGGHVLYYGVSPNGAPLSIPGTIGAAYGGPYGAGPEKVSGHVYDLTPAQINKADELVALGIFEKKEREHDYPEITFAHRKKIPGTQSAEWVTANDIPKVDISYWPIGAHFNFLLVDIDKKHVSLDASWTANQARRPGGGPGTSSTNKTYVIPSGDVAFVGKEIELKKLFKHLMTVDPRVTSDYTIVSPDDKYEKQTIGAVATKTRTTDVVVGSQTGEKLVAYHGTSTKRWPEIEKNGMIPGKYEKAYVDQIPGYSVKNLYFTMDPHDAENYATRAAIWDVSSALILKVEIPDITKIRPDEDTMNWFDLSRDYTLTQTGRESKSNDWDEINYKWVDKIKKSPGEKVHIAKHQHMKQIMEFMRMANRSKTDSYYTKSIDDEPTAGPEWEHDEEYAALMKDIDRSIIPFLTAGLTNTGAFAYKGRIPPKFVKRWKEYPRKPYPKSVEQGLTGAGDAYDTTRQAVLKKTKKYEESLVRSLVQCLINETNKK